MRSLKTDCVNQPLQFQAIYSDFLTIFYQETLTAELELVHTPISHITITTTFAYICKHHEPFHIIKVLSRSVKNPFCKISTLYITIGVLGVFFWGGGGNFSTSFHAIFVCLGSTIIRPSYLKFRQALISWGKNHFFSHWGLKLKVPKIKSHSTRASKTIPEPQESVMKLYHCSSHLDLKTESNISSC